MIDISLIRSPRRGAFEIVEEPPLPPLGRFRALSSLPGIVHAVTTAAGPLFDPEASSPRTVAAAGELARHLGLDEVAWVRQVHRDGVLEARRGGLLGEADALVTDRPGLGLLARSADCPLIMLAGPAVGLAHASWRATALGIAGAAVAALRDELGVEPGRLRAAIGPSAGPCCYEVGQEVVETFRDRFGPTATASWLIRREGTLFLDLWAANRYQLERAGVQPQRIQVAGVCTICDARFPSHRRQKGQAARFGAAIGLVAREPAGGGRRGGPAA